MSSAVDPGRCPLCGEANDCGMLPGESAEGAGEQGAGRRDCWCFHVQVDPGVLQALPEGERGRRCICRRCACPSVTITDPNSAKDE